MDRANWGKLVASAFGGIAAIVLITGCCQERIKSVAYVEPQCRSKDLFVSADAGLQQTTTTTSARPLAKRENIGVASTKPSTAATVRADMQLDSRIDFSGITADMPLGRAVEVLRNSVRPPLNIVVFWNDLRDNASIDQQTPVGVDIVHGVSLRKNLEILLASLSTRRTKLDYTIINGVIVIATKDSMPKKMQLQTCYITDLSSRPADYYSGTSGTGVATRGR